MATIKTDTSGISHLPGGDDMETLCGYWWTGDKYIDGDGLPNCYGCIEQAKSAFTSITKAELKKSQQLKSR